MATRKAVILLMGLLLSFCDDSFGASGWTEVRNPDTYTNRALAEFAYGEKKRYRSGGLTFLVTQARHKYDRGTEYQLGFIAYQNGVVCVNTFSAMRIFIYSRFTSLSRVASCTFLEILISMKAGHLEFPKYLQSSCLRTRISEFSCFCPRR
ncbi:hypothetical protein MTO96_052164 [Rhipicephalus appendiculatus]